jgi:CubicO group peptidase (beta-lactamase class C family)
MAVVVDGYVAPGYEGVREAFVHNFEKGKEIGAACAAYVGGEKVVDLWGGYRSRKGKEPWLEDTMALVFSTTKGVSSAAVAHAHARGLFSYDEPMATYWPEFAVGGKEDVTVRQVLSHQAGLCAIDVTMDLETLADADAVAAAIECQAPSWEPGTQHGYHGVTLGWYESELLRRVDPQHRTIGRYFADEIAGPLGLDFYIGLPDTVDRDRVARVEGDWYRARMIFNIGKMPGEFVRRFLDQKSISARAFANPEIVGIPARYNDPEMQAIELPASNGIGTARSIAKLYGVLATGGEELGLDPDTLAALEEPAEPPTEGRFDEVLRTESAFSLGYCKPWPGFDFGSPRAFGTPGAGGSFGFADPELGLGFAYVMNRMDFYLWNDPREVVLRDAVRAAASARTDG